MANVANSLGCVQVPELFLVTQCLEHFVELMPPLIEMLLAFLAVLSHGCTSYLGLPLTTA